jgi:thymidylate synthase (FAD)
MSGFYAPVYKTITVIKHPRRYQMQIIKPSAVLEWATPDAVRVIERAGRTCYKSEDKITDESAEKFVRTIIKSGHDSVLEHAVASFRIVCDRGVTHELVRHRLASYSQESTRYCKYSGDKFGGHISIIHPNGMTMKQICRREAHFESVQALYDAEIAEGVKPQIARGVLPTCLKTEIVCTMNFREWRHTLKLRTSPKAHPQIVEVMNMVKGWFRMNYPVIVEDIIQY